MAGEAPESLSATGGRLILFGRFSVTWRALEDVHLKARIEVHSPPCGGSALAPLSNAAVMPGLGGTWVLGERVALEVAVSEDDGTWHAAPDIGLHAALLWRLWVIASVAIAGTARGARQGSAGGGGLRRPALAWPGSLRRR